MLHTWTTSLAPANKSTKWFNAEFIQNVFIVHLLRAQDYFYALCINDATYLFVLVVCKYLTTATVRFIGERSVKNNT